MLALLPLSLSSYENPTSIYLSEWNEKDIKILPHKIRCEVASQKRHKRDTQLQTRLASLKDICAAATEPPRQLMDTPPFVYGLLHRGHRGMTGGVGAARFPDFADLKISVLSSCGPSSKPVDPSTPPNRDGRDLVLLDQRR